MSTQLILTVGTNALPVWVAWYHLKDQLEKPIKVQFIYTNDTKSQKDLLVKYCEPANFGQHIQTSPGNPAIVRRDVKAVLNHPIQFTDLHIHYTGGTKVMSVETVAALEYDLPCDMTWNTTYLDPRGKTGPTIVDSNGIIYKPSDARNGINVDLNDIALLNGFTLAPFGIMHRDRSGHPYNHEYYDRDSRSWERKYLPVPAELDTVQEEEGIRILGRMHNWADPDINPCNFEYAAYVALKQALEGIETTNSNRSNYKVYHNVYVKRTGANIRDPEFELDVVAVLGYQIVVVSCTHTKKKSIIKEKGMEVILRARQLGGDEAQAIVLCGAHRNGAQLVQKELHDEVGSVGDPLRVWGTDKWANLQNRFTDYLKTDLHWR